MHFANQMSGITTCSIEAKNLKKNKLQLQLCHNFFYSTDSLVDVPTYACRVK